MILVEINSQGIKQYLIKLNTETLLILKDVGISLLRKSIIMKSNLSIENNKHK